VACFEKRNDHVQPHLPRILNTANGHRDFLCGRIARFHDHAAMNGFPHSRTYKQVKSYRPAFTGKQVEIIVTVHYEIRGLAFGLVPFNPEAY
jgi:hypothetical protein